MIRAEPEVTMLGVKGFLANGVCRGFVGLHGAQQGIGKNKDFSSDSGESDFRGFAASLERSVKRLDFRVMSHGGDSGLVESDAYFASAAADVARMAFVATVVVVGS